MAYQAICFVTCLTASAVASGLPTRTCPRFRGVRTYNGARRRPECPFTTALEQVPEELIVYFVVILHFRSFYERAELARTALGGGLLQGRVTSLDVLPHLHRDPFCIAEVRKRFVNLVRQVALGAAQVFDFRQVALGARLEHR